MRREVNVIFYPKPLKECWVAKPEALKGVLGCKTLIPKRSVELQNLKAQKECWVAISLTKTDGSLMSLALLRTEDSKNVEDCKYCVLQHLRFEAKKSYR